MLDIVLFWKLTIANKAHTEMYIIQTSCVFLKKEWKKKLKMDNKD